MYRHGLLVYSLNPDIDLALYLDLCFQILKMLVQGWNQSEELECQSKNLKRQILLSTSARQPATPSHPCTTLTHLDRSSQCCGYYLSWILIQYRFQPPNLIAEHRVSEPISTRRGGWRERIFKARNSKRQLGRVQLTTRVIQGCNPQPMNPSITISTLGHLKPMVLHAWNYSSGCCKMTLPLALIQFYCIALNGNMNFKTIT